MKKILFVAALIVSPAVSQAADMARPYTKAPAMVPGVNWTGFFIGAGGGYGMWNAESHSATAAGVANRLDMTASGSAYIGTVSGGFDWQVHPSWVVGTFGDMQFGDIKGATVDPFFQGSTEVKSTDRYAAGARIGYLVTPSVLSYVNAGYSHTKYTGGALSRTAAAIFPETSFNGWFVGGGFENSLNFFGINAPGWFMKSEYRVSEYDNKFVGYPAVQPLGVTFKPIEQTFTTQLVYRLGVGAAPLARPAPAAPLVNWTGLYVAGGGGYGMFDADTSSTGAAERYQTGGRGYYGTVGGGLDLQLSPSWVVGVFGDAQFGDIKGNMFELNTLERGTLNTNASYAAGARLGYLIAPNVLSYVNAGYSHADFKGITFTDPTTGAPTGGGFAAFGRNGYFLGSGVEHSLDILGVAAPGWFLKSEYRYAKYDTFTAPRLGVGTDIISIKPAVQTFSISLVYRFNWGGRVVAKY